MLQGNYNTMTVGLIFTIVAPYNDNNSYQHNIQSMKKYKKGDSINIFNNVPRTDSINTIDHHDSTIK